MESIKNMVKGEEPQSEQSQFSPDHRIPVSDQEAPGHQHALAIAPVSTKLPSEDGGYQTYRAAGKLQGKAAIITGGDSGIGRAVAILFAMEGADSLIAYLPEEEKDAQETKRLVAENNATCHLLPIDLTEKENCETVVRTALQKMGKINILVNNAAYQMMQMDIADISDDQWYKTFDTNIHSMFHLSKMCLPHMKSGDTIINCASINPYIGRPDLLDYTSTKGAIVAFTRALSNQQISKGIRVNCVCPGPIWTPLIPYSMNEDAQKQFTSPMGRPGQPSEVATCFVFLASQDSSFISGQSLHPNGGTVVNG